jgi:hypothetical protein
MTRVVTFRAGGVRALFAIACVSALTSCVADARREPDRFSMTRPRSQDHPAQTGSSTGLGDGQIESGLREALRVGTDAVVQRLGRVDGFNLDPEAHIPLPRGLKKLRKALARLDREAPLDDLELQLNRAAETALPGTAVLIRDAIAELTFDDVQAIHRGPDDAATRYLESRMADRLARAMRPIVGESLAKTGAIRTYDKVAGKYADSSYLPDFKTDLSGYVVERALAGFFHYLAAEETTIRREPARQVTELLRRVFDAGVN